MRAPELFTEFERNPDADVGVMFDHFVTAIGIWVYTNEGGGKRPTVADAARAFNTTVELVREAVGEHPWLDLSGIGEGDDPETQIIVSDGE